MAFRSINQGGLVTLRHISLFPSSGLERLMLEVYPGVMSVSFPGLSC